MKHFHKTFNNWDISTQQGVKQQPTIMSMKKASIRGFEVFRSFGFALYHLSILKHSVLTGIEHLHSLL